MGATLADAPNHSVKEMKNDKKKKPTVVRPASAASRVSTQPNHPKPFYLFVASRSPEPVLLSAEIVPADDAKSKSRANSPVKESTAISSSARCTCCEKDLGVQVWAF